MVLQSKTYLGLPKLPLGRGSFFNDFHNDIFTQSAKWTLPSNIRMHSNASLNISHEINAKTNKRKIMSQPTWPTLHNRQNRTCYVIASRLRNTNYDVAKSEFRYAEMFYIIQNSQNFSGLFLSSCIPKNTTFRKLDLFPSSAEGGEKTPTQLGPLERASDWD
jgi:hypothetical protein